MWKSNSYFMCFRLRNLILWSIAERSSFDNNYYLRVQSRSFLFCDEITRCGFTRCKNTGMNCFGTSLSGERSAATLNTTYVTIRRAVISINLGLHNYCNWTKFKETFERGAGGQSRQARRDTQTCAFCYPQQLCQEMQWCAICLLPATLLHHTMVTGVFEFN